MEFPNLNYLHILLFILNILVLYIKLNGNNKLLEFNLVDIYSRNKGEIVNSLQIEINKLYDIGVKMREENNILKILEKVREKDEEILKKEIQKVYKYNEYLMHGLNQILFDDKSRSELLRIILNENRVLKVVESVRKCDEQILKNKLRKISATNIGLPKCTKLLVEELQFVYKKNSKLSFANKKLKKLTDRNFEIGKIYKTVNEAFAADEKINKVIINNLKDTINQLNQEIIILNKNKNRSYVVGHNYVLE